jgi:predicted ATP-dependent serine protease
LDDLDCVGPQGAAGQSRDVYIYVISGYKVVNPSAAMALIQRLR